MKDILQLNDSLSKINSNDYYLHNFLSTTIILPASDFVQYKQTQHWPKSGRRTYLPHKGHAAIRKSSSQQPTVSLNSAAERVRRVCRRQLRVF